MRLNLGLFASADCAGALNYPNNFLLSLSWFITSTTKL